MVFGGKSQIKELRRQVSVLNAANEKAKAEEVTVKQADSLEQKETIPAPILEGDLKPTLISSDIDPPQTGTLARSSKSSTNAPSAPPTSSEPLRQIKTPAVDILIIMVEERK